MALILVHEIDDDGSFINYMEAKKFYIMNTFFKQKPVRKWTWAIPDGKKSEIVVIVQQEKFSIEYHCHQNTKKQY